MEAAVREHERGFARRGAAAFAGLAVMGLLAAQTACTTPARLTAPERYAQGVVFVLPGIEGRSVWNRNIALGLEEGGVNGAIEIYDWTVGVPGSLLYNLVDLDRNRWVARRLADRIIAQREKHPHAPIHIVGHSGGGGVALLALEELPSKPIVDSAFLLAAAVSTEFNLCKALRRTKHGIVSYYSKRDAGLLVVGTTLFGSIDRYPGPSAGAVGFRVPDYLVPEDRRLYADKVRQVEWDRRLRNSGARGDHFSWTSPRFVREQIAPTILRQTAEYDARLETDSAGDQPRRAVDTWPLRER